MKRPLAAALVAAMSLSLLAGCEQEESNDAQIYGETEAASQIASEDVTITFFGFKVEAMNLTAIEDAIHGFTEENPGIEVEYEGVKGAAYGETLALRLENNTLDDIFMVHHNDVLRLTSEGKETVGEEMLKGMNTEDAVKLLGELIRQ